jgi:sugar phosphate permease
MAVLALSVVVAVSEKPAKGRREVVRLVAMIEAVIVLVYFTTSRMMMSVVVLLTMSVAVLISVTVIKAAALLALLALMAVSKQVAQGWWNGINTTTFPRLFLYIIKAS